MSAAAAPAFVPPDRRDVTLPLVYRDAALVVVDKPEGLLAVPGRGSAAADCVARRIAAAIPEAQGPLVAHRLDMDTSGLMVLGLDPEAQRHLAAQFEGRQVDKTYEALVQGWVEADHGVVRLAFRLDPERRPYQVHDPVQGKLGETQWSVVARERAAGAPVTRLRLEPRTGRTHQLRLHTSHPLGLGHPILGDRLYGDAGSAQRLMLHAAALAFTHPTSGRALRFSSAVPF